METSWRNPRWVRQNRALGGEGPQRDHAGSGTSRTVGGVGGSAPQDDDGGVGAKTRPRRAPVWKPPGGTPAGSGKTARWGAKARNETTLGQEPAAPWGAWGARPPKMMTEGWVRRRARVEHPYGNLLAEPPLGQAKPRVGGRRPATRPRWVRNQPHRGGRGGLGPPR